MTIYHPYATSVDLSGNELELMCYDGVDSMEMCVKQFDIWEEYGYRIKTARVQVIESGKDVQNIFFEKKWVQNMMDKPISFCPACGRKVKWDD